MERTFAIIKPDAVERKLAGKILDRIEAAGFSIVGMKKIKLSMAEAEGFYCVHKERPFFKDLCAFMSRSPVIVLALKNSKVVDADEGGCILPDGLVEFVAFPDRCEVIISEGTQSEMVAPNFLNLNEKLNVEIL